MLLMIATWNPFMVEFRNIVRGIQERYIDNMWNLEACDLWICDIY